VPAVTSLLILGAGVTVAAYTARGEKRRRLAILRYVAQQRNGTLDVGGWFGNPRLEMRQRDGTEVTVSMWSTKHGAFTELDALIPAPGLPRCKLVPAGFTGGLAKALGAQDIEIGHPAFDDAFNVKGEDGVVIRRVFARARARELALLVPKSRLECDGSRIKLLQPVIESVEQVGAGIDLVLELARSDPYGLHVLGELPEAQLVRETTGLVRAQVPGPSPILVGPAFTGGLVRTCVRTAATGTLPPDAETLVTPTGGYLEQTPLELRIWWRGIETDRRRLGAAIDLLRRLSSAPAQGVFR